MYIQGALLAEVRKHTFYQADRFHQAVGFIVYVRILVNFVKILVIFVRILAIVIDIPIPLLIR